MKERIRKYYLLITLFFIFVLITLALLLYHSRQEALILLKEQYNEQQSMLAEQTAIGIEENFAVVVRELEQLTNMCAVKTFDLSDIQEAMVQTYNHVKKHHIYDIGFINAHGVFEVAFNTTQFLEGDFSDREYFLRAASQSERIPIFQFVDLPGNEREEKGILIAMPIFADDNSFGGVILLMIKLHEMIEGLSQSSHGMSRTWVIDAENNILYHPQYKTGANINNMSFLSESFRDFIAAVQAGDEYQAEYFSPEGAEVLAASYPTHFADQRWSIVITTPAEEVSSLFIKFNLMYAYVTIAAMLAIIGGSMFMVFLVNKWNRVLQEENRERLHAEQELKKAHDELEQRIEERTVELHDINAFLEKEIEVRKVAEAEAVKQNELVRNTIESLSHPFYVINADNYVIQMANTAADFGELTEKSTCYSLTHHKDHPCDCKDHPCTIKEIKEKLQPVTVQHTHYKDGEARIYEVHGYPIFDRQGNVQQVIEYTIDITESRKLQEQLHQSQKMESIGRLAGGVAHDFNNILTAIIGYSELAQTKLSEGHHAIKDLKIIREAGDKAAVLVRKLLAFSRKQFLEMQVVDLNKLINDMLQLLGRIIGEDVFFEVNASSDVGNIKADPGQIEQVVMNLVVNARDAMPEGGRISIETSNVILDEEYAKTHEGVTPGPYTMLAITDSGKGMTREVQEKIFEPFFTTKGSGGTGLGLATVYGIVKQHNGHIFVYSEQNVGSTFKVYFPVTEENVRKKQFVSASEAPKGNETLLIVDDDRSILNLIIDTLSPLGYTIIDANCAEEVLEFIEHSDGRFDLLLTDMVMPGMNGRDLAKAVRKKYPETKVIFMSGYTSNMVARQPVLKDGEFFIQKPLSPLYLAGKIRQVLDS